MIPPPIFLPPHPKLLPLSISLLPFVIIPLVMNIMNPTTVWRWMMIIPPLYIDLMPYLPVTLPTCSVIIMALYYRLIFFPIQIR